MNTRPTFYSHVSGVAVSVALLATQTVSQVRAGNPPPADDSLFSSWTLYIGVAAIGGLIGLAILLRRRAADLIKSSFARKPSGVTMTYRETVPKPAGERRRTEPSITASKPPAPKDGISFLPISTFKRLQKANGFVQMHESHDAALLDAIERTNEESEENVQVRTEALKLLSSFKTSNSITAIAQMALYDLSSKLRSDAVQVLADMDHESVFETIVTCCADPTREVRASAARALFKLTFDRAQAWVRVVESKDVARMRHVARCAIEGDLVERSFERLPHADRKIAYEAFALTGLLVKAGETEPVYKAIANHRDDNVRLALLHVLQVVKEDSTFERLSELLDHNQLTPKIVDKVNEVRSSLQMSHA